MSSSMDEKINILMEKINILENSLSNEREKRIKYEDELNNLKSYVLPNLEKTLDEKESLCRTSFIERVRIEKELQEKIKSVKNKIINFYNFSLRQIHIQYLKVKI